ncbi:hypothetical protein GGS20DRAFT_580822 [Poronia punctata]|nr:hypothetical protein GGS20DRAFT_580822 [Poronia punctata]
MPPTSFDAPGAESDTTAVLQAALDEFHSTLTTDDLAELHKIKNVPDTDAVMVFTAQLDMRNATRKGRSFSSRLYTFLQSVGDICKVIDTFISARPEIAALAWGSVKLAMLIATSYTSSYETISETFLELGRLCPILREYEVMYQSSERLQQSLCRFNAAIIRFCKDIIEQLRRPWHVQILSSLRNDLQSGANTIKKQSQIVRDELQLAKAQAIYQDQQLQIAERKAASESRRKLLPVLSRTERGLDRLSSQQLERDKRHARERRRKLLDALSAYDYLTPLKQSRRERQGGTAQWIFQTPEFGRWIDGSPQVLWCSGKIGSGKTILA